MFRVKENSIDCHGVLISYPVARKVEVEGVEVNLCVLGRCLLWIILGYRGQYKSGALPPAQPVSYMVEVIVCYEYKLAMN